jgi:hypothetical protein
MQGQSNDYSGLGFPGRKLVISITVFPGIGPSWFRALPLPVSLPTLLEE